MRNEIFAERLKQAMRKSDFKTARQLAKASHITDASVSRYISGDRMPNSADLPALARVLNVSCDYLLGFTNEPGPTARVLHVVLSSRRKIGENAYTQVFRTIPVEIPDDGEDWHVAGETGSKSEEV